MPQPSGLTEGSVTFEKEHLGAVTWWMCSRHVNRNRTTFLVSVYRSRGQARPVKTHEWLSDPFWGKQAANEWIEAQIRNKIRGGYSVKSLDGAIGPESVLTLLKQVSPTE